MKYKLLFLLLCFYNFTYAQMQEYAYKSALSGVQDQWHQIQLPNELFKQVKQNVADIRIYGITPKNDTIEVPYIWIKDPFFTTSINFKTINTSQTKAGHFITFEIPISKSINAIQLDFKETNFDWKVQLEGSQDQKNWYTIIEDYRILSIENTFDNYQFTSLNFPDSKYQYYRVHIPTEDEVHLLKASIAYQQKKKDHFINYPTTSTTTNIDQQRKTSQVNIQLPESIPVSAIKVEVAEDYDYYRPITIQYASDSIKTTKGWKSIYHHFGRGILNSSKENEFLLNTKITDQIRLTIHNADNPPLSIAAINISGIPYQLTARFTESANYFLAYGNPKARKPTYDLKHFSDKIPNATALEIGPTQKMPAVTPVAPLFANKAWLWGIMLLIIGVLGWFTLKMMADSDLLD